jgi:hypothetical protein
MSKEDFEITYNNEGKKLNLLNKRHLSKEELDMIFNNWCYK